MQRKPTVLVFDVNETLLDVTTLEPFFERLFGDAAVMRQWFAELVLYAQTVTLAERYVPFDALAAGCLRMVGAMRSIDIVQADQAELAHLIGTMPAHPDVVPTLDRLQSAGFELATLTNSAPGSGPTALERAGLAPFFHRAFTVDMTRRFKPAPAVYARVAQKLGAEPKDLCLVACHAWDTIGAQAMGWQGALVLRPNNAALPVDGVPMPDLVVGDMNALADRLTELD